MFSNISLSSSIALAFYVTWLFSFPLQGQILQVIKLNPLYFLIAHSLGFFNILLVNRLCNQFFRIILYFFYFGTPILSLIFLFIPLKTLLLILIGQFSTVVPLFILRSITVFNVSPFYIALGLMIGNVLSFLFNLFNIFYIYKYLFLSLLLFLVQLFLVLSIRKKKGYQDLFSFNILSLSAIKENLPYQLIFFLFYLSGGLFHSVISIQSIKSDSLGLSFIVYSIAVFCVWFLFRKNFDFMVLLGLFLLTCFFSIVMTYSGILESMFIFLIQIIFAFLDLSFIYFHSYRIKDLYSLVIGFIAMTLGIVLGMAFNILLQNQVFHTSNFILYNISTLIGIFIYIILKSSGLRAQIKLEETIESNTIETNPIESNPIETNSIENNPIENKSEIQRISLPELEPYLRKLSEKERIVLLHIIEGKTYKEIAKDLDLAESTVKTYTKRILEKFGFYRKHQLLDFFAKIESEKPKD